MLTRRPTFTRLDSLTRAFASLSAASLVAIAGVGCEDGGPPTLVASIDGMTVIGDCDSAEDNPGDFAFTLAIEEIRSSDDVATLIDPEARVPQASEAVYIPLAVLENEPLTSHADPDVDIRGLEVSFPYPTDERLSIRVRFQVTEDDGGDEPQWDTTVSSQLGWDPEESCWLDVTRRNCIGEPDGLLFDGVLDFGTPGSYCEVEIDWSIWDA